MLRLLLTSNYLSYKYNRFLLWHLSRALKWLISHVAVGFLLWSLWLSLEFIAIGPSSFVRIWDEADSYLPACIAQANKLLDGQMVN